MNEKEKATYFEEKILPVLNYIGLIGAIVMSIAYIVLIVVMIMGFKAEKTLNTTVFAVVSAGVGFLVLQCLKIQGQSFAEIIPENREILELYYGTTTKDKKSHSMTYYWVKTVIIDFISKAGTVALTSIGLIYLIIEGSKDYMLILLGIVNLLMFISFGFLGLVKTYNYFNRTYIKFIKEKLSEVSVDTTIKGKEDQENGSTKTLS